MPNASNQHFSLISPKRQRAAVASPETVDPVLQPRQEHIGPNDVPSQILPDAHGRRMVTTSRRASMTRYLLGSGEDESIIDHFVPALVDV
jgi:hypothetical protein